MLSPDNMPSLQNFLHDLQPQVLLLGEKLRARKWHCATAESCTGGLAGTALTSVSGASQWFAGGIIAYDNSVKSALLRVPSACIDVHGAVSREVVCHMAQGVCKALHVPVAMAITGVAGPSGGTPEKPVGTVWLGFHLHGQNSSQCLHLEGDRDAIRQQAVALMLRGLLEKLG